MKRIFAAALGLIAGGLVAWADIPDFDDSEYRRVRRAYQYNAVATDSINVDRLTADTVIIQERLSPPKYPTNMLPTCNSDSEGDQVYDTTESLPKTCTDVSGSYQWLASGGDADQDGFRRTIDQDDSDNTVFARNLNPANVKSGTEIGPAGDVILTGTLRYEEVTARSVGTVTVGGNSRRIEASTVQERRIGCFYWCAMQGDLRETAAGTTENVTADNYHQIDTSPNRSQLQALLEGTLTTFPADGIANSTTVLMSCNCIDTAG